MKASTQPDGLIRVLLDTTAPFGDRHDPAMDLGAFDQKRVEDALAIVASDARTDVDLADACGESLAENWLRKRDITMDVFLRLIPASQQIALATLRAGNPELSILAENALGSRDGCAV